MQNSLWFICGLLVGLTILSITKAAVPSMRGTITDDTALYENLSEMNVKKELKINFDRDIQQLSEKEKEFKEKLPFQGVYPSFKGSKEKGNRQKKKN